MIIEPEDPEHRDLVQNKEIRCWYCGCIFDILQTIHLIGKDENGRRKYIHANCLKAYAE